ncbi:tyrosine-type recombinase/integrase [Vibrio mexicanus]|uniref:tyrosine-type recombinase/integrase n=1 Tax=Vibrio mexicanus TaxID=1004326 RepID=UPI00063CADA5|nr:tyrosine-type recombinase/integrase [Vibrio mexicanus]
MKKEIPPLTSPDVIKRTITLFSHLVILEDVDELTHGLYSRNSLLAMTKDWNLFVEFCLSKRVHPLPASSTAVRLFLENESKQRKYATIRRYAVTIGLFHRIISQPDPTTNPRIRQCLADLRLKKKGDAKQAVAFTSSHFQLLVQKLANSERSIDHRNLALAGIMFECALKRSETKNLSVFSINMEDACTTLHIEATTYQLSDTLSAVVRNWVSALGATQGPLFRAIDRHGNIGEAPMDDSSIYRALRTLGEMIGGDFKFSGQSLRIGAVRELASQGHKVKDIQEFGRWLSPAMPYQYLGNKDKAETEKVQFKTIKPWG